MPYSLKSLEKFIDKCGYEFKITYCFKAYYMAIVIKSMEKYNNVGIFLKENKVLSEDYSRSMTLKEAVKSNGFFKVKILFNYILKKLVTPDHIKRREFSNQLINIFKKLPNDNVIYRKIRDMVKDEDASVVRMEKETYASVEDALIHNIHYLLKLSNTTIPPNINILDIGTERISLLEKYKSEFNSNKVIGINIGDGFCHYDEGVLHTKELPSIKFMIYDGKNIPKLGLKYDFVTITSVIHHITLTNFTFLLDQLYDITNDNALIFIKDNNINDIESKAGIIIQHMIFEGSIVDSPHNPLYPRSFNDIKNVFAKHNFNLVAVAMIPNFSHAYYALFRKKVSK